VTTILCLRDREFLPVFFKNSLAFGPKLPFECILLGLDLIWDERFTRGDGDTHAFEDIGNRWICRELCQSRQGLLECELSHICESPWRNRGLKLGQE